MTNDRSSSGGQPPQLKGQVALVTGCGRRDGIGRAVALELARQGADVAVTDLVMAGTRNEGENATVGDDWRGIEAVVEEIAALGRNAVALTGDVAWEDDVERLVAAAVTSLGRIDILVNNAGAPHGADRGVSWEIPIEAYDKVMGINARGTFMMSRAVIRHLLARREAGEPIGGRIVNIASGAGKRGFPERASYCASKFAVVGLTQTLALECGDKDITVNAVCPGWIATSRATAREARGDDQTGKGVFAPAVPRAGSPDDVAKAVAYLAGSGAAYVTGQSMMVDGGMLLL